MKSIRNRDTLLYYVFAIDPELFRSFFALNPSPLDLCKVASKLSSETEELYISILKETRRDNLVISLLTQKPTAPSKDKNAVWQDWKNNGLFQVTGTISEVRNALQELKAGEGELFEADNIEPFFKTAKVRLAK